MNNGEFYSRGKFLLSAEYLVLHGAKALAIPLKFGQKMLVKEIPGTGLLRWETYIREELWFAGVFQVDSLKILESSNEKIAFFLQALLKAGGELQPELLLAKKGYEIQNHLDFDINWGLGSSSSLVSNLAYWLNIDPYILFRKIFQGSGYDVFCARAKTPIVYQLKDGHPEVSEAIFKPSFADKLYFVYSGRKQDSQESVRNFKTRKFKDDLNINEASALTEAMINAATLSEFQAIMNRHEELLSSILGIKKVKDQFFADFPGEIKSLGAWGGDFVMAGSSLSSEEVKDYFRRKGLNTVFRWDEIVF